jgi:hypothetical protein
MIPPFAIAFDIVPLVAGMIGSGMMLAVILWCYASRWRSGGTIMPGSAENVLAGIVVPMGVHRGWSGWPAGGDREAGGEGSDRKTEGKRGESARRGFWQKIVTTRTSAPEAAGKTSRKHHADQSRWAFQHEPDHLARVRVEGRQNPDKKLSRFPRMKEQPRPKPPRSAPPPAWIGRQITSALVIWNRVQSAKPSAWLPASIKYELRFVFTSPPPAWITQMLNAFNIWNHAPSTKPSAG